ncbi:MAG: UDP-N-acetylmuramoyl-L-alanyl-D-glutamate--2,6-diaminopimelate ligase [candidate division WS2 bacterium]|uniref:UDP-N-acetylmuramoyl-L-alanyl-D-glutamate--2, 6-diaminopimelate ligase n=1 Tax=Psychracetigena formicireducens TaxID=2986056 RepID=A0A9E2F778_PSYF1|nr:UDP-N-acetylmuramoyl-L-alanyl-D-glutamate--2,6-diaminopimelate ligase [Candidatus Psychracetigena formicireducens]
MYKGVEEKDKSRVLVVSSRKDAIKTACMMLHSGDILLVAGKGHETYQEIAGIKSHFSDWEEVQEAFNLRVKN